MYWLQCTMHNHHLFEFIAYFPFRFFCSIPSSSKEYSKETNYAKRTFNQPTHLQIILYKKRDIDVNRCTQQSTLAHDVEVREKKIC